MLFRSLFNFQNSRSQPESPRHAARDANRRRQTRRLFLETLEDRRVLAFDLAASYAVGLDPQAIVSADFNGDTRLDLAVANEFSDTVSVLLGNAGGSFQSAQDSSTGTRPVSIAVGDFNVDGKLDLATVNNSDISILLGNGDGTFRPNSDTNITIGSDNPQCVAAGDFDGDGRLDLGVTSNFNVFDGYDEYGDEIYHYEGHASVILGNGDGTFVTPIVNDLGYGFHVSAVVADFNGDAKLDFAEANLFRSTVSVLLGDGAGRLLTPTDFFVPYAPESLTAGLLNGDGNVDLVATGGDGFSVLLGTGTGAFGSARYYASSYRAASIALGDFNNDSHLDIATSSYFTDMSVVLGRGDGTFKPPRSFTAGTNPWSVATGDFNGDGWADVATANYGDDNVSVLINDQSWPPPPPPSVSINDVSISEGNTGTISANFEVRLSGEYNQAVTVHFATADWSASAGSDYNAASGDVTFNPGEIGRTISIALLGDRLPEPTETFVVNLSGAVNSVIADGQGLGTIVDNEPRISISDVTMKEGNGKKTTLFVFTVSLSVAYDQAVTISYQTMNGTATTGDSDYIAKTGTLTFAPGETTKTITIEVKSDGKKEANEPFYLDLFDNSSNSSFTKKRGTGTITNDD